MICEVKSEELGVVGGGIILDRYKEWDMYTCVVCSYVLTFGIKMAERYGLIRYPKGWDSRFITKVIGKIGAVGGAVFTVVTIRDAITK